MFSNNASGRMVGRVERKIWRFTQDEVETLLALHDESALCSLRP